MNEKKIVLLQLGTPADLNPVGQLTYQKDGSVGGRYVVEITLDHSARGELIEALTKGDVKFTGIVPSVLDFYSVPFGE